MKKLLVFLALAATISCTTVEPGHKGVEVSWGGETNMTKIYDEGLNTGLHWMWDDMVEYDCREQTVVNDFEFNDLNNMSTGVEISVDFRYNPKKVNFLHTEIADVETKLIKTIKSAGKEVIPNYGAVDLNLTKRGEAEERLSAILSEELTEFYLELARVQITDVDIPQEISEAAKRTAEQIEKNKLAAQMAEEKTNLGNATIAEAKALYEAAQYEAKAAQLKATTDQLKLKELEIELEWARQGKSRYGENNVFGASTAVVKGLTH